MNDNTELIGCVSHDCAACKKQADALLALQAVNQTLQTTVKHLSGACASATFETKAALARLAELGAQKPVGEFIEADSIGTVFIDVDTNARVAGNKLYLAAGASPQPATGCACKWQGEVYESRCELHEAWHVAIQEWAERAKNAEAKLSQPVQPSPAPTCDLRGIDAGQLSEWVDLVKHGYVAKDECLIAVKDVPKWVAQNDTQPVQPAVLKPLTDKQVDECVRKVWGSFAEFDEVRMFTREIEAAHNIAQPVQPSQAVDGQDAARYRWFADIAVSGDFERAEKAFSVFEHSESCTKQEVDAAIDAAINAKGDV